MGRKAAKAAARQAEQQQQQQQHQEQEQRLEQERHLEQQQLLEHEQEQQQQGQPDQQQQHHHHEQHHKQPQQVEEVPLEEQDPSAEPADAPIAALLTSLRLDKYHAVLAEQEVDMEALALMDEGDLKELGLPKGPRVKLLHAVENLGGT